MNKKLQASISILLAGVFSLAANETMARTPNMPLNWHHLYSNAWQQINLQNYSQAELLLKEATDTAGGEFYQTLMTFDLLDEMYEKQGDYKSAEKVLLSSLLILKRNYYRPRSLAGLIYLKLAMVNYFMKDFHRASFFALLAVPCLEESAEREDEDAVSAFNNLGWIEYKLKKLPQAEEHLRKAIKMMKNTGGEQTLLYGLAANNLARTYESLGESGLALFWYSRSAKALKFSLGEDAKLTLEVGEKCRKLALAQEHCKTTRGVTWKKK